MTFYQIKVGLLILLLLFTGCIKKEKDEITLPGKIMLKISLAYHGPYVYPEIGGSMGIKSIRFEGKRDAGEDVFFETNPETIFPTLDIGTGGFISDFDIPRGVYNYMKMEIDMKRIVTKPLNDLELDSLNIGLYFVGKYDYGYGDPIEPLPFFFTIDDTVKLSFRSEVNQKFVLSDEESGVSLLLDPFAVIQQIGQDVIENLEPSGHVGHQIILISNNNNKGMHAYILSQICQTARIIF
jgi:hypothetical protein